MPQRALRKMKPGHQWFSSGMARWAILLLLWVWLSPAPGRAAEAASLTNAAASPAITTYLEYQELDQSILTWGSVMQPRPVPFLKEPDWAGQAVERGVIRLGAQTNHHLALIWNYRKGLLHLDFNRNGDLTDDPGGIFSASPTLRHAPWQVFSGVPLGLQTNTGWFRILVDLHLAQRRFSSSYAQLRSWWQGQLTLRDKHYQLALVADFRDEIGSLRHGYVLLRPWESRLEPADVARGNDALDGWLFFEHLFIQNQAYGLRYAFESSGETSRCRVELREEQPELGTLELTGQFIDRVLFEAGPYLVFIDQPEPAVKIPVGTYEGYRVRLKQGQQTAYREWDYRPGRDTVSIKANISTKRTLGGPLTNSVTVHRRGRYLELSHQLLGAGGIRYLLDRPGGRKPPQFTIYKGDKKVAAGQFEFG